jgi:hypothetical protein
MRAQWISVQSYALHWFYENTWCTIYRNSIKKHHVLDCNIGTKSNQKILQDSLWQSILHLNFSKILKRSNVCFDYKFWRIIPKLQDFLNIRMSYTTLEDHVLEAERNKPVFKVRSRSVFHRFPFRKSKDCDENCLIFSHRMILSKNNQTMKRLFNSNWLIHNHTDSKSTRH